MANSPPQHIVFADSNISDTLGFGESLYVIPFTCIEWLATERKARIQRAVEDFVSRYLTKPVGLMQALTYKKQ